ncbi:MAG: HepT-like ribonuclease domain-containing protein [Promethearchaeia archaeon]
MEKQRILRYREKFDFVQEKIQYFNIKPEKKLEKWGLFYAVQTSIESIYDLIAMLVKDIGLQVKDDENNVNALINERNLDPEIGKQLKDAKGMRNVIVHQYNGVNEQIVLESLPTLKSLIKTWLNEIEVILNEIGVKNQD